MEFVAAASVKWFSCILRAQYVLYVVSREMETSSESNLCAFPVRLSLFFTIITHFYYMPYMTVKCIFSVMFKCSKYYLSI